MKTAFLFPGQGSQSVGMLSELASSSPGVTETFAEASQAIGLDVWALVQNGPVETLNQTENTQPAILTASVAMWREWISRGGSRPDMLAGHSLGEYSALVCADVMTLTDAVALVKRRGQLMQSAVPEGQGAMAAILGLTDDEVLACCAAAEEAHQTIVSAVNFNSPGQVVIAGTLLGVDDAIVRCKAAGAKRAMRLPVSAPSHCALMQDAAAELAQSLDAISMQEATIPVIQNVAATVADDLAGIKKNLIEQLYSPVLWSRTILALGEMGIETAYECGPGKVLTGLNKRINRALGAHALDTDDGFGVI